MSILSTKVLFGPSQPIRSYLVHIGLIRSILSILTLFGPHWSYIVHYLIRSIHYTLALFSPHWSYSVHYVHFDPRQSYWGHLVQFSPFCPLWFYSVHYVHFGPIQSILLLFSPLLSNMSTSVIFIPIWSRPVHSVYFGLILHTQSTSVQFGHTRSYSVHLVLFGPHWSYSVILSSLVLFGHSILFSPL